MATEVRRRRLGGGIGVETKPLEVEVEAPVVSAVMPPVATVEQRQHNLPPELTEAARKAFLTNRAAAAATKAAEVAKAALVAMIIRGGYPDFEIVVAGENGGFRTVDITMAAKETEKIDIAALQRLISNDDFLKIVTAAKATTEKVAGKNVLVASTKVVKGEATLSMKERKDG